MHWSGSPSWARRGSCCKIATSALNCLVDVLPRAAQRALGIAVSIIAICACLVLTWKTGVAALQYIEGDIMMARIWRIPRIWPYSIIPIGSLLHGIRLYGPITTLPDRSDPERELHKTRICSDKRPALMTGAELMDWVC